MERLVLNIKDNSKLSLILQLVNQFDFVEVEKIKKRKKNPSDYNFFNSAGLWANREIDTKVLRSKAWNFQK